MSGAGWAKMTPTEFKARRLAFGLGSEKFADMLRVRHSTVKRWENGQRPIPAGVEDDLTKLEDRFSNLVEGLVESAIHRLTFAESSAQFTILLPHDPHNMVLAAAGQARLRLQTMHAAADHEVRIVIDK